MSGYSIEPLNYKYLGIAIVLLIICYYFLQINGNKLRIKPSAAQNIQQKTITVYTKNGDIVMDPNIFELHLKRTKNTINELNNNLDNFDYENINDRIIRAKKSIGAYIDAQNINTDICSPNNQLSLVDNNMLNERDVLRDSIETSDDSETRQKIMLRYAIIELMIDIDIILFLVRSSMCKYGKLDLTAFDELIMELYNSMGTTSKLMYDELNYELTFEPFNNIPNLFNPRPVSISNRLSGSQKTKDKTSTKNIYTENIRDRMADHKNRASFDNSILLSHELSPDFADGISPHGMSFISNSYTLKNLFEKSRTPQDIDLNGRSSLL